MLNIKEIKNKKYLIRKQDNLEFMKILPNESVSLIYCDILYGTGRDFDDYKDLKFDKNEIYNFYKPRLEEMYRLLKSDGTICIHCDFHIIHWIRNLLDDIFGYKNCVSEIIWKYKSGGASKKKLSAKHDNIIVYAKNAKLQKFNPQKEKSYNRGFKPYRFKGVEEFEDEIGWYTMINMQDVWEINMVGRTSKERVDYATQKPIILLNRIISLYSNENDVVADFFMGSGTTGEVALELNRKFIGCDIGEKAFDITKKRLESL